ncbi:MAG: acyl-CoA dehydrogenase [Bdellovibrionales bacterium]|nr:acyl-CoA dehydrogenase [Bdellovibrionales bacterium]
MIDANSFELTEEERMVQSTAREFAQREVAPLARKIDHEHYFPKELIPKLGSVGFMGVNAPAAFGGSEMNNVCYAIIIEELARVCASTSVIVSAHNSLCLWPITSFGTDEQKKKYVPKLSSAEWIGCFALSEPGTGSDAARQTCMAVKEDGGWRVNGVKNWITNGPVSDVCVLFTMEDAAAGHKGITAFIVDMKTTSGVSLGKKEEKLGICGSPTSSIIFEDCFLPESQLLGKSGEGFKVAMKTLDGGRCGIAAQAVGIARAALEDSAQYASERKAFGKPIAEHQSIQNYLADMSCSIDAARLLTWSACRRKDAGVPYSRQAAQAKLFASETAMASTVKGVQIHGGYGFVKEFNVERYMRDAKITEIYEGTSEIQRLVIAANLLKEING